MAEGAFDVLLLVGRPASGKSEIIDFLTRAPLEERRQKFHVAELDVLDDFPMLWAWFEEDHILTERFGQPRLHTEAEGYFKYPYLWHLLIERLDLEYHKRLRDDPAYHDRVTTLIEFSRGSEHGGYAEALPHLSDGLLRRAGVVYVSVSFEESLRKNRRRFNPDRPDTILEHGLPDEKLERLYRDDDWGALSGGKESGLLAVKGVRVPFVVLGNEGNLENIVDEGKLADVLDSLWRRAINRPTA
ncbi:MAG: hypothetical protein JW918_19700 [Anaerolineae bacterium]|nr:hypothetical protein [Anaerolineae bacterium]